MHPEIEPTIWSVIPFVLMLLAIAIVPLFAEHWWHSNKNKLIVSMVLGLPIAIYLISIGRFHDLEHQIILDYIPFVSLLAALFYISGGIVVRGDIKATPLNNSIFLFIGSVLASFIGTTGASMLLIRPLLKSNSERKYVVHTVIFFIFLVSNIGGLLTPLGDPPLFLGYLRGVPFTWTFRLFPEWMFTVGVLLVIYFIWDTYAYKKETIKDILKDETQVEPIRISGAINFLWLLGVVIVVAFVNENYEPFKTLIEQSEFYKLIQVPLFLLLIVLSKVTTPEDYRKENDFNLYPIVEVAALFIGIFITMIPALILLKLHGHELGLDSPIKFFYASGAFSSFLDNAPTYLVFFTIAQGTMSVQEFILSKPLELAAVSLGSVFMGAMTYIGNAPNFMVRSIAEQFGIKMPSFGGYMIYSILILQPVFLVMALIFL
ncbi:MAG: sodium:proton antiporter [Leptospiraceae bacterium]|jgi:Na+/H+ antiporter NhaD/arsenite permease-like protein|nr:sodium:proton antiporter [Leptospiraceae bacterium]